jgi:hypothetical protein
VTVKSDTVYWKLALVPYNGKTREIGWQLAIFMDEGGVSSHETLFKTFYQALLKVPRLSPKIRRGVMEELEGSLREYNRGIKEVVTIVMRMQIEERKQELQKGRQRLRGGVHERAVEEIAHAHGMTAAALKKRLQRNKQHRK